MDTPLLHRKTRLRLPPSAWLPPALAGALYGYDIATTSTAAASLPHLTLWPSAALHAASTIGAAAATLLTLPLALPLGRRGEILLGSVCYLAGTLTCASAPEAAPFVRCALGRVVYGLGVGFSMHAAPAYIAEVSPAESRGSLVSLKEVFIVCGMVVGFAVSAWLARTREAWRWVWLIVPLPVSLVILGGAARLPASPRWLLQRGRRLEAERALGRLRHGASAEVVRAEFASIDASLEAESRDPTRLPRRALAIGLSLVALQQLTGQPSVLLYATDIFAASGLASLAPSASLVLGLVKLLATLASPVVVDSVGRRSLLLVGISLMLGSLLVLTLSLGPTLRAEPSTTGLFTTAALGIYVCGYQIGFGPITWLLLSEIFPLRSRAQALSIAAFANFGLNSVVTFCVEPLEACFEAALPGRGHAALFGIYSLLCIVSLAFVYNHVPETRGLALEQIRLE